MTGKAVGEDLYLEIAKHYIQGSKDMSRRAPGLYVNSDYESCILLQEKQNI